MIRPGKRVTVRRRLRSTIRSRHRVTPDETVDFLTKNFKVNFYE